MIGFIVTGHGHFATGLTSAAELVTGKQEALIACDFDDMSAFDSIRIKLEKAVAELSDAEAIVIFCDLLSGTPYNQAIDMRVSSGNEKIQIVYGTNLPLLIEAIVARNNESTLEEILEIVDNVKYAIGKVDFSSGGDDEDDF